MKFRFSSSWRTIVVVLVSIGLLFLALGGYLSSLSSITTKPFMGVQEWFYTRYAAVQSFLSAPADLVRLQSRNTELEAEVASLQTQVINLQRQVTEVEILSALLDFARAQPENEYQAAAVIGIDPSPFMQYVIINRGSDDGLRRGMPVVSEKGLVGRIAAVTANAARVQLITDPSSTVNVSVLPSETSSMLHGSITSEITLEMVPQDAKIFAGDLVLTSGLGGNYPSDILVGQVTGLRGEATDLFLTASVQPLVDFSKLEIVLVIVNFHPIDIEPLIPQETPTN